MGADKLLLDYNGKTLLQHSIDLLQELPVYERIVVTTDARQKQVNIPCDVKVCINAHPEQGQSSSIKVGVEVAVGTHYFFLVADQPMLTAKDLIPLLDAAINNPGKIIFPVIDLIPSSPTIFPSSFKEELKSLQGDIGGRAIRDAHKDLWHTINPENPGNFTDIDNTEDYAILPSLRAVQ